MPTFFGSHLFRSSFGTQGNRLGPHGTHLARTDKIVKTSGVIVASIREDSCPDGHGHGLIGRIKFFRFTQVGDQTLIGTEMERLLVLGQNLGPMAGKFGRIHTTDQTGIRGHRVFDFTALASVTCNIFPVHLKLIRGQCQGGIKTCHLAPVFQSKCICRLLRGKDYLRVHGHGAPGRGADDIRGLVDRDHFFWFEVKSGLDVCGLLSGSVSNISHAVQ